MIKLILPCCLLFIFCLTAALLKKRKKNTAAAIHSEKQDFLIDTITAELKNPWGIAFLPDGRTLITERAGEIRIVKDGKLLEEKIQGYRHRYTSRASPACWILFYIRTMLITDGSISVTPSRVAIAAEQ